MRNIGYIFIETNNKKKVCYLQVVLQKALQEIEHKEELLNTSSRMLQEQEAELEHVQDELQQMETENTLLRQNVDLISQEAEITK